MNLEQNFRETIPQFIEESIQSKGLENPILHKKIWDYKNDFDFRYGQRTGFIIGVSLGYYLGKFGKQPSSEDLSEILEIIQAKQKEIKKSIS